jgi:Flp pilus assembly protein protease CpaA
MEILNPNIIFFSIILIIGVLTTFTDLKNKKIYNQHLAIGAILGLIAAAYAAVFRHEHILFHIINGLVAFLIGSLLHRFTLWKGGDAKLFTLYAFLMPTPVYSHILFPSVINLFACSFIAGTIILIPAFIKDIIINHEIIAKDLFLPAKRQALFKAIVAVVLYSWILFPFYCLARNTNPIIILTISYFIFSWLYKIREEVKKYYIIKFFKKNFVGISLFIVFGFLMRLWLFPNSLSYPALTRFLIIITLSAAISTCIHTTFDHFKNYQERVPFAPLLFMGCVLSYTPFLTWLMHLMARWNILFSR